MRILKYLSIFTALALAAVLALAAYIIVPIWSTLPSGSELRRLSETVVTPIDQMPDHVHLALLAAENSTYLTNGSTALRCVTMSFTSDTWGACNTTIPTMALSEIIRNLPCSRKHAHQLFIMVVKIEHYLTRDQILELALNQAYFGARTYGITQAADVYFGKAPANLTLAESALIAGQVKAPSRYNPHSWPEAALERRNHVLNLMAQHNMITKEEGRIAITAPLGIQPLDDPQ